MKTKQAKPVTKDMFPADGLVALSGGWHSTIALFWALQADIGTIEAISFYHGQKTQHELTAARKIAELAGVKHRIVRLPAPYDMENDQLRNVTIAAVTADYAVRGNATFVCMGITAGSDYATRALQDALRSATGNVPGGAGSSHFDLATPLVGEGNADMILLAYHLPGCWNALGYTHASADDYGIYGNAEGFPLIRNGHNVIREKAFLDANMPDPLVYRAIRAEKMAPPDTPNYTVAKIEQFCGELK